MTDVPTLNDTLAGLVGAIPGVTTLYSPEPVIARAAKITLGAITRSPATTDRIRVTDSPAGVAVTIHLGVSRVQSAAEVCRAVYEEIVASITAAGQQIDCITIKVARIS